MLRTGQDGMRSDTNDCASKQCVQAERATCLAAAPIGLMLQCKSHSKAADLSGVSTQADNFQCLCQLHMDAWLAMFALLQTMQALCTGVPAARLYAMHALMVKGAD